MKDSTSSPAISPQVVSENGVGEIRLLTSTDDDYSGVVVEMEEPMDPATFVPILRASISHWRELGKKTVWIKLPIGQVCLAEPLVKEGFWYHHAEPEYLMLIYWIPKSANNIPANATHRVCVGGFVMNGEKILVVQEKSGPFWKSGVWKFPTGAVDQGEHICAAAVREVKEETGVDTEFVEALAFKQTPNSYFTKSELLILCMLRPLSFDIQVQEQEIEAARWMPFEEYAAQRFNEEHQFVKLMNEVCRAKIGGHYSGFNPVPSSSYFSNRTSFVYLNSGGLKRLGETHGASQNFSQVSSAVMPNISSDSLLTFPIRIPLSDISKLTKECEIVTKVTIQKVETEYGWTYDGCPCDKKPVHVDNKLKCMSCNQEVLMTEPKFKVHYKVFDSTGKCSMLFFNRHASALLECSASELKKVGLSQSFPRELDRPIGKEIVVMVKVKENNIKYPASSMGVSQFSMEKDILHQFTYSDVNTEAKSSPMESSSSYSSPKTLSTHKIVDDDDLTISQIITPVETALSKRKRNGKNALVELDDVGLSEVSTPSFSSTKPAKNIKKEK